MSSLMNVMTTSLILLATLYAVRKGTDQSRKQHIDRVPQDCYHNLFALRATSLRLAEDSRVGLLRRKQGGKEGSRGDSRPRQISSVALIRHEGVNR